MARLFRDRYLWYIATLVALSAILLYPVQGYVLGGIASETDRHEVHMLLMTLENSLFLVAVAIAAWRFRIRGGLIAVVVIGLIVLPHLITNYLIHPRGLSMLAEYVVGAVLGIAFSWLVGSHRKMEEALRESEARYRALIELGAQAGEAIVMLQDIDGKEGVQTYVNDQWIQTTGYHKEKLLGTSFFDLVKPEDRASSQERHQQKMNGQSVPGLFEMSIIRKDGSEVPVELTSAYSVYKGQRANVAYVRDISGRKRVEKELRDSESRLRLLAQRLIRAQEEERAHASLVNYMTGWLRNWWS